MTENCDGNLKFSYKFWKKSQEHSILTLVIDNNEPFLVAKEWHYNYCNFQ